MIKSVEQEPVHSLLSPETNIVYQVPRYQREYSWTRPQWDELFDDLLEADSETGHFLGTIICLNQTSNSTQEVILELIDGQQRITTLSLLLAAIHGVLRDNIEELDDDERTDLTNLRRQLALRKPTRVRVRPQHQNFNNEDYLNVLHRAGVDIDPPKVKNLGNRRIMKAYVNFTNRLVSHADASGVKHSEAALELLARVKKAILVKLEVANHADAFVLFESLNNRGMPLTPIDLIKNSILAAADRNISSLDVDSAFNIWNRLLADLGDDYSAQERFFRHYYNAFKGALPAVANAPVATRSKLIRIYETFISGELKEFLDDISLAGSLYKRIIGNLTDEDPHEDIDTAFRTLARAQGAPSYILLLFLLRNQELLGLTDADVAKTTRTLASFFVRRNLTGTPQTYSLPALFMRIVDKVGGGDIDDVAEEIRQSLRSVSSSDESFLDRLAGPIYDENSEVTRFILTSLTEAKMTKETERDLWEYDGKHYKWTIEHILPQGHNLPEEWIEMLGGDPDVAAAVQQEWVHTLGNLTLTGYNSNLSNKSFDQKKNRIDSNGNYIGFRNGLSLNENVMKSTTWDAFNIKKRGESLRQSVLELFPL